MAEESSRGIKPVWLIGGGAALVSLALCAVISLTTAAGLIWFSSNRADNAAEATQVVVQRATEPVATAIAPTRIAPTPLPGLSTQAFQPTVVAVATQIVPRSAPDQAVRTYYDLVSQQRYDVSWPMLTDSFKQRFNCCAPNYNYTGYVDWWNSVDRVEFGDVRTVSQSGDRAVVYAELYWVMNNGQRSGMSGSPYIELVYDTAMGNWRIEDTRARA
ncbi:MAG: hypothetical protein ABI835_11615 [Chloroflexota bacterium]